MPRNTGKRRPMRYDSKFGGVCLAPRGFASVDVISIGWTTYFSLKGCFLLNGSSSYDELFSDDPGQAGYIGRRLLPLLVVSTGFRHKVV